MRTIMMAKMKMTVSLSLDQLIIQHLPAEFLLRSRRRHRCIQLQRTALAWRTRAKMRTAVTSSVRYTLDRNLMALFRPPLPQREATPT
jgi:hypothetical protein